MIYEKINGQVRDYTSLNYGSLSKDEIDGASQLDHDVSFYQYQLDKLLLSV
jgi:hypothetical protein